MGLATSVLNESLQDFEQADNVCGAARCVCLVRSGVLTTNADHAKPQPGGDPADSTRGRGGKRQRKGVEKPATGCCWRTDALFGLLYFAAGR